MRAAWVAVTRIPRVTQVVFDSCEIRRRAGYLPSHAVGHCSVIRPELLPILGELLPLGFQCAFPLVGASTLAPPVIAGGSVTRGLL
jgi:hypothetical protein